LAEGSIFFTVSTDVHNESSFKQPFEPEKYCNDVGIIAENVNVIVNGLPEIRTEKPYNNYVNKNTPQQATRYF